MFYFLSVSLLIVLCTIADGHPLDRNVLMRISPITKPCYSITGAGNNKKHPHWGELNQDLARIAPSAYIDGIGEPPRQGLSPRLISQQLSAQSECTDETANPFGASDYIWAWGQFMDHDLGLVTPGSVQFHVHVPSTDPMFMHQLPVNRSLESSQAKALPTLPREQNNHVTAFIDASTVYGSDDVRASALRTYCGGLLKTTTVPETNEELPPYNFRVDGHFFDNFGPPPFETQFLGGDVRINEVLTLTMIHTLFIREHNRLCRILSSLGYTDDETIYQTARALVIAEIQSITYNEFLPVLLGSSAPRPEEMCYEPYTKPVVFNEFTAAAYRMGHTLVGCEVLLVSPNVANVTIIPSRDLFFLHPLITQPGIIDDLARGLAYHPAQKLDIQVVDTLRNFLFHSSAQAHNFFFRDLNVGHDLISINIQRARDHGLPDYNDIREALGLPRQTVQDITTDPLLQYRLIGLFGYNLTGLDPWPGIMSEESFTDSQLGSTGTAILRKQFENVAKGDRCFYEWTDSHISTIRDELAHITLKDIIIANTNIYWNDTSIGSSAFFHP